MKFAIIHAALLTMAFVHATPVRADGRLIFADDFTATEISSDWEVHDGNWSVDDGALINDGGGLITLKTPPGGRFSLEFEIAFPSNWMSIVPLLTKPDNYATFYLTNGYWETFEMKGEQLVDYVQHRDSGIVTSGGFHHIKIVSEFGLATLYFDGEAKGPTAFPYRPGSRIGFRSLPNAGVLKIKNLRVSMLEPLDAKLVHEVSAKDLSRSAIYHDRGADDQPPTSERLRVDATSETAGLTYQFTDDDEFENCFARIPLRGERSTRILMDVDGDGSENNVFIIVHDASGEQHLVLKTLLAWQGPQEVGINLKPFLESPPKMERHYIHWGGDENQRIDFPITAIDIGVAKHGARTKHRGEIDVHRIRFTE